MLLQLSSKECPHVNLPYQTAMARRNVMGKPNFRVRDSIKDIHPSDTRFPSTFCDKIIKVTFFPIMHFGNFILEDIHCTICKKARIAFLQTRLFIHYLDNFLIFRKKGGTGDLIFGSQVNLMVVPCLHATITSKIFPIFMCLYFNDTNLITSSTNHFIHNVPKINVGPMRLHLTTSLEVTNPIMKQLVVCMESDTMREGQTKNPCKNFTSAGWLFHTRDNLWLNDTTKILPLDYSHCTWRNSNKLQWGVSTRAINI